GFGMPRSLLKCLCRSSDGILNEDIHLLDVLAIDVGRWVEPGGIALPGRNKPGDLGNELRGVEPAISHNSALAFQKPCPHGFNANTKRAHHSHAGNYDRISRVKL